MAEKKSQILRWLFLLLLGGLSTPVLWNVFGLPEIKELKGSYERPTHQSFSFPTWWDGSFQANYGSYIRETFGFRSICVRSYNQQYYSLFNTARANSVIIGEEGFLYEENYLKAITGTDFVGDSLIDHRVKQMEEVSEALQRSGTELLILLAPGKASHFPEYMPAPWREMEKGRTNYESFSESLGDSELRFLDFHAWFEGIKEKEEHPLFPRTGIHWSKYGEIMVADSLIQAISEIVDRPLPQLVVDEVEWSDEMETTDDDIEQGMNLLFDLEDNRMAYPRFHIEGSNSDGVKVLTIADSYFWGMYNWGMSSKVFDQGEFWFYNEQIFPIKDGAARSAEQVDIREAAEKNDLILLLSTDANLYRFPFGFIDRLHRAYFQEGESDDSDYEERIQYYTEGIMKTPDWLESVQKHAEEKGITLEQAIRENAEYMVWKEKQENEEN